MSLMSPRRHHAAGRIVRRVDDDELGAVGDQALEFVDVEAEVAVFADRDGHGLRAQEVDHRLVDREAGIGIDDLIAFIDQREHGEEDDRLAAGNDDHFVGRDLDAARLGDVIGNGLPQLGQSRRGAVVGVALLQRFDAGSYDVGGSIEVGLADFEVDDVLALRFEGAGANQNFKGSFGAQTGHPLRKTQFSLCGWHRQTHGL